MPYPAGRFRTVPNVPVSDPYLTNTSDGPPVAGRAVPNWLKFTALLALEMLTGPLEFSRSMLPAPAPLYSMASVPLRVDVPAPVMVNVPMLAPGATTPFAATLPATPAELSDPP